MPPYKVQGFPAYLFRCDRRFLCRFYALSVDLPHPLGKLLLLLTFPPYPGQGVFAQLRVLGSGFLELEFCRRPGIAAFRLPHLPGRAGANPVLCKTDSFSPGGLRHKLRAVGALNTHIFIFRLINLAMNKVIGTLLHKGRALIRRPRCFPWFLMIQHFAGMAALVVTLLHPLAGLAELLRFRFFHRPICAVPAVPVEPIRWLGLFALLPELAVRGCMSRGFPFAPPPVFVLWDTLSRSVRLGRL